MLTKTQTKSRAKPRAKSAAKTNKVPERYLSLIHRFPLRLLNNADDISAAVALRDELEAKPRLTKGERDYLEVLTSLLDSTPDKFSNESKVRETKFMEEVPTEYSELDQQFIRKLLTTPPLPNARLKSLMR